MVNLYNLNISKYSTHKIIIDHIGRNKVVLDIGCNDGYIGKMSHKSNIFYGLDYSKDSIINTKKIYKDAIDYDLNNLEKLTWDIKFDLIIFADVLEHVLFPEDVLKYFVKHYLKKNGIVIVSLPNVANFSIRLKLFFGNFNYTETGILDKTHLKLYTDKTCRELFNKCNLKVIEFLGGSSNFGFIINKLKLLKFLLSYNLIYILRDK